MLLDTIWADIKYQLELKGHSFASLARENGCEITYLTGVKKFLRSHPQKFIAKALGKKPEELWPSRYVDGVPLTHKTWQARLKALKHASNLPRPRKKCNASHEAKLTSQKQVVHAQKRRSHA